MYVEKSLPAQYFCFYTVWKKWGVWIALAFSLVLAALTSGCASPVEPKIKMTGSRVGAVGHYGRMIGVPDYYVNGRYIGNVDGWGGGELLCGFTFIPFQVEGTFYDSCEMGDMRYFAYKIRQWTSGGSKQSLQRNRT
ncbi:hypothetical protein [Comamonas composti]|uniref:hypothetical protein n=1 Tax=Comamonas composti TaxID=408558 RepID=UPI001FE233C0|nr:hypothetical protein [Comamonas composti]